MSRVSVAERVADLSAAGPGRGIALALGFVALWAAIAVIWQHMREDDLLNHADDDLMQGQSVFQPDVLRWSIRLDTISTVHPDDWPEAVEVHGIAARLIADTSGWVQVLAQPGSPTEIAPQGVLAGEARALALSDITREALHRACRLSRDQRRTTASEAFAGADGQIYAPLLRMRDLGGGQADCLMLLLPLKWLHFTREGMGRVVRQDVLLLDTANQPLAMIGQGKIAPEDMSRPGVMPLAPVIFTEIGASVPVIGLPEWRIVTRPAPGASILGHLVVPFLALVGLLLVCLPLWLLLWPRGGHAGDGDAPGEGRDLAQRMVRHERRNLTISALLQADSLRVAPTTPRALQTPLAAISTALSTLLALDDRGTETVAPGTRFDPLRLAQEVLQLQGPAARSAGVTLRSELDWQCGPVIGPREALVQIVTNLLLNTFKYAPGAQVTLRLWSETLGDGRLMLAAEVADTGPGVDPAREDKLFVPGYQVDPYSPGQGLGLPIIARLARDAHGRVQLRNRPGEGFAVTVRLPVLPAGEEGGQLPLARLDGLSVLVVEDMPALRDWLVQSLRLQGAEATGAEGRVEALAQVQARGFDAAIIDLSLGDGSGFDLAGAVRAMRPDLALIAYSADIDPAREAQCREAGFVAVHRKSASLAPLIAQLGALPPPAAFNRSAG